MVILAWYGPELNLPPHNFCCMPQYNVRRDSLSSCQNEKFGSNGRRSHYAFFSCTSRKECIKMDKTVKVDWLKSSRATSRIRCLYWSDVSSDPWWWPRWSWKRRFNTGLTQLIAREYFSGFSRRESSRTRVKLDILKKGRENSRAYVKVNILKRGRECSRAYVKVEVLKRAA
jgi:hypothetical protein